jgi:NTE family protein
MLKITGSRIALNELSSGESQPATVNPCGSRGTAPAVRLEEGARRRAGRCLLGFAFALICITAQPVSAETEQAAETSRPRIGLVLGGGGALGLSHVGVIRALEEMRIPIDYIAGTSMGAIIGGMYASGLSPDEMEQAMTRMNWWDVMKDKTVRQDMAYRRKRDDNRYLMSMEVGFSGRRLAFPFGLAAGQKFNNVIQTLTVNAAGITEFSRLNIPFCAMGTDIQTGKSVVLTRGNLGTAMRASMAVPGAFTPVVIDGRMLVDGGLVANLPVEQVRAMGADIVIAVDVGLRASEAGYSKKIESMGDILSRTYAIMSRPGQDRMGRLADVLIAPDVTAFSASEFQKAEQIIPVGRTAVAEVSNQLARFSVSEETYRDFLARQRKKNEQPWIVRHIGVTGNERVSSQQILCLIHSRTNQPVDLAVIERDASRIYGLGEFENVTQDLQPVEGGYDLQLITREKNWGPGYLRLGFRMETDGEHGATWGALLNATRRQLNELGGEIQLDLEIGTDQKADLEWFQPLNASSTLFLAPSLKYHSVLWNVYTNDVRIAEYEQTDLGAGMDVGSQFYNWGEIRAGLHAGNVTNRRKTGVEDLPDAEDLISAWTTKFALDRLDDAVFATRGFALNIQGFFAEESLGSDLDYSKLSVTGAAVKSFSRHSFIVAGGMGHSLDTEVPLYDQFTLGGFTTLPGLAPEQLRGPYYALASLSYRFRLGNLAPSMGDGVYFLLKGASGNVWQEEEDLGSGDWVNSFGTGLGADTVIGPILIGMGFAESMDVSFYFSLGTVF